jgi:hypothetical protein
MSTRQKNRPVNHSLALLGVVCLLMMCAGEEPSQEYKVKAAFIFNFARFVGWPASAFAGPDAPFVIAVVGTDPFDGMLEAAVAGKVVGARPVVVKHFASADDIDLCQILFIPAGDDDAQDRALKRVVDKAVLTIGESDNFITDNGCLRFFLENDKMRFEINADATDRAQLKISSKLLRLAKIDRK